MCYILYISIHFVCNNNQILKKIASVGCIRLRLMLSHKCWEVASVGLSCFALTYRSSDCLGGVKRFYKKRLPRWGQFYFFSRINAESLPRWGRAERLPRWGLGALYLLCHYNALTLLCQCDVIKFFLYVFAPLLLVLIYFTKFEILRQNLP